MRSPLRLLFLFAWIAACSSLIIVQTNVTTSTTSILNATDLIDSENGQSSADLYDAISAIADLRVEEQLVPGGPAPPIRA